MEKCKLCGEALYTGKNLSPIIDGNNSKGSVHQACRDTAISLAIIEREAERAKVPTLEDRVCSYIIDNSRLAETKQAREIIAMVRKHDAKDVDKFNSLMAEEWKIRAEKAEAKLAKITIALRE